VRRSRGIAGFAQSRSKWRGGGFGECGKFGSLGDYGNLGNFGYWCDSVNSGNWFDS
jgi:hypothetical protein